MLTRNIYVMRKKRQLDSWSAQMDKMEAKAKGMELAAKDKFAEHLATFRAKRAESEKRLTALKTAGKETWEVLKAESENLLDALKDSFNQFKLHFPKA